MLGHESGFAPDGKTFYASSAGGQTFVAIDLTDPTTPTPIFQQAGVNYHGLRVSDDGRTMYVANIGNPTNGAFSSGGLRILDISEIQDRVADPEVDVLVRPDLARALHPAGGRAVHPQRPPLPARGRRVRELQPHRRR